MVRILVLMLLAAGPLASQERTDPERRWLDVGLYGFGVRGGLDLRGGDQAVAGATLDVGYVYTPRLRLRLSGELGFLNSPNSYVGNLEMLYRFLPESSPAVPYIGGGLGLVGNEDCGAVPECPGIWAQFALGFEIRVRDQFSWLLEYHPEDALRRHRLFLGLTTRLGGV